MHGLREIILGKMLARVDLYFKLLNFFVKEIFILCVPNLRYNFVDVFLNVTPSFLSTIFKAYIIKN